jgi:hypothetical protein
MRQVISGVRHLRKQENSIMANNSENIAEEKYVSIFLGIGIFLIPIIFSWFTLRKGHTTKAKIISFSWLVIIIIMFSISDDNKNKISQPSQKTEIASNEVSQKFERKKENNNVFKIIKDQKKPNIKRSVDVRIKQRVSIKQLKSIALKIKESDYRSYNRTFILYYLPNQIVGSGAWASSHFNPTLEVKILELNLTEYEDLIKSAIKVVQKELIGQWYESLGSLSRIATVYKKGRKVLLHHQYHDGSKSEIEVKLTHTSKGIRIDEKKGNSYGEFYLVNRNKYLELWDSDGIIGKYESL